MAIVNNGPASLHYISHEHSGALNFCGSKQKLSLIKEIQSFINISYPFLKHFHTFFYYSVLYFYPTNLLNNITDYMTFRSLLFSSAMVFFAANLLAQSPKFEKTSSGIIVYTDSLKTGFSTVRLEVVSDEIIRVQASPGRDAEGRQSFITVKRAVPDVAWTVTADSQYVALKTQKLKVVVKFNSAAVSFFDIKGRLILREKEYQGRIVQPVVYEGERSYMLSQQYEMGDDDALYGLGQHQDGIMNYRGHQVKFFQNNTEVAIPFLISNKNYGILWDNTSITTAGDIRELKPLSALQLFSKNGQEGWLTASYINDKTKDEQIYLERAEDQISMEFLGDSKLQLPQGFTPATGMVRWQGSIKTSFTGEHRLRFTFGGSVKVWLGGKLLLDHWRKAWNPTSALVSANLKAGEKMPVIIEWIPEGGESYISLKWQEPPGEQLKNNFGFSSEAGQQIDYYFVYGADMDAVISGYRKLTGKAPIPPVWALGFWQSRERYKSQQEILSTVSEFRKRKIPIDNIVLDWSYWPEAEWGSQDFDKARFPSFASMVDLLHRNYNTKIMISVWPKFYEGIESYNNFDKKGWLYLRNVADRQRDWIGKGYVSTSYDAFNADAREGFWNLIYKKLYTKGVDAWWMDASEPDILSNVSAQKRIRQMTPLSAGLAAENVNAYPLLNAKGIFEGQRKADPDKRVFLLTRSGFAGSQRYGATIWSGDIGATWRDMKMQIAAGLNFSMSGLPYWTMDIGGFVVPEKFEKPDKDNLEEWRELLTRWTQFGAFVPLFRSHGQFPVREIFNLAPDEHPAYKSFLYYDKLRYRLLPYIYSLAGASYHQNGSIMRALPMDFPEDKNVLNISDQYMFGSSLLINPVLEYKSRVRELYLPKAAGWFDLYTGKWFSGNQTIIVDAPYDRMPVYVKAGSIIPFGPELQYSTEKRADTITLNIYGGANALFTLYEDDGISYQYEKGAFTATTFKYDDISRTITVEDRKGAFKGMIKNRIFKINLITRHTPKGWEPQLNSGKKIHYEGKQISVRL